MCLVSPSLGEEWDGKGERHHCSWAFSTLSFHKFRGARWTVMLVLGRWDSAMRAESSALGEYLELLVKSLLKLNMKENAHNHLSSPLPFLIISFFATREFITSAICSYNKMLLSLEKVIACMSCVLSCFSHVWLFETLWTVACQTPLSMGFSREEYWSGLPCPTLGDLPSPGIESASPVALTLARGFFTTGATWEMGCRLP